MSSILPTTRDDPEGFEGRGRSAADRFEVRERSRVTGETITTHERFPTRAGAGTYAADRTAHEPALYGEGVGAPYELFVADAMGWRQ